MIYLAILILPLLGTTIIEPIVMTNSVTNAKEVFALLFCLAIITSDKHGDKMSCCWKDPVAWLFAYIPVSMMLAPPVKLMMGFENLGGLWMWKAFAWACVYFMVYRSILAYQFLDTTKMVKMISLAAILSAGYGLLQLAGLDQFQITRGMEAIGSPKHPEMTAFIGNSTMLAAFLAICLPFVLNSCWHWALKSLPFAAIMATGSDTGAVGLGMALAFFMGFKSRLWRNCVILGIAVAVIGCGYHLYKHPESGNGRYQVWQQAIEDWHSAPMTAKITDSMTPGDRAEIEQLNKRTYPITGLGIGSWRFWFVNKHQSKFDSAHNEYIETLYSLGIIGLVLLLWMAGSVLWGCNLRDPFFQSFAIICFCCATLPILHQEPFRFFAVIIFSICVFLRSSSRR